MVMEDLSTQSLHRAQNHFSRCRQAAPLEMTMEVERLRSYAKNSGIKKGCEEM